MTANHAIRGCVKTCRFAEEYHVRRKMFGAQRRALIWKICFNPVLAGGNQRHQKKRIEKRKNRSKWKTVIVKSRELYRDKNFEIIINSFKSGGY